MKGRRAGRPVLLMAAAASVILTIGCGAQDEPAQQASSGNGKCAPLKIGSLWEETGQFAVYGIAFRNGARMAIDKINAEGGFDVAGKKYCFEPIELDTRSDVATAVAATRQVIRDEGVKFVLGPAVDTETIKTQEITNASKVIMFAASTILDSALEGQARAGGKAHYLFKTSSAADTREGSITAQTKAFLPDTDKVALVATDDSAGQVIGDSQVKWFEEQGWSLTERINYPPGTTDWSSYLTRLKRGSPDQVWVNYIPNEQISILKQALSLKLAGEYSLFSVDPASYLDAFPEGIEGATVVMSCNPKCPYPPGLDIKPPTRQVVADFWKEWSERGYEFTPGTSTATLIYDYVFMLRDAISAAGTVEDTDAIVAELEGMRYEGVLDEELHFDENHVAVHGWDVCLAKGKDVECVPGKAPTS